MPRYFFHLRDGDSIQRDTQGFLCSDLDTAGEIAKQCMKEMLAEGDRDMGHHTVEIADSDGAVLATICLGGTLPS
jgi:hypothetical protein